MPNGIDPLETVTARTLTAAAGNQWTSAHCNAMQDNIIAVSEAVDLTRSITPVIRTATINQSDTPAPDTFGSVCVEVEVLTTGTTEVVLDTAADWRDRRLFIQGRFIPEGLLDPLKPGGVDDHTFSGTLQSGAGYHWICYTEAGQTGSAQTPGAYYTLSTYTDEWRLYARASDGALCMKKSADVDAEYGFIGRIWGGPIQNHY